MKGLGQFRRFDWDAFTNGKAYQVVGISDWIDHDTGKRLGKRVDTVITRDDTIYEYKRGEQYTNLYERVTFKTEAPVDAAIGMAVVPVDVTARCYGEYQNQLSVTCKGIRIVQPQSGQKKTT